MTHRISFLYLIGLNGLVTCRLQGLTGKKTVHRWTSRSNGHKTESSECDKNKLLVITLINFLNSSCCVEQCTLPAKYTTVIKISMRSHNGIFVLAGKGPILLKSIGGKRSTKTLCNRRLTRNAQQRTTHAHTTLEGFIIKGHSHSFVFVFVCPVFLSNN